MPGSRPRRGTNRDTIRNRRVLAAAGILAAILVIVLIVDLLSGGEEKAAATDSPADAPTTVQASPGETPVTVDSGERQTIEGTVDKPVKLNQVQVLVTALAPAPSPAVPDNPVDHGEKASLGSDQSFYQAFVRVSNEGDVPVRIDPENFALAGGKALLAIDATRSGPPARTLLRGATLNLIVTFRGPAGLTPFLVYAPPWMNGELLIRGSVKPAGMT